MKEQTSQNIIYDKKNRAARSRHSSLVFVPICPHNTTDTIVSNLLLKRITEIGDKGKRF